MKALTALNRPGGDYSSAIQHLADTLPETPRRGQIVQWAGEDYRLNRRAVADVIHAGGNSRFHGNDGNYPDFLERRADLAAMSGCDEAHRAQAMLAAMTDGRYAPIPCPHCGETPAADASVSSQGIMTVSAPNPDSELCPNGHPEQFQNLLAGIQPTPCPKCGETPVFHPIDDEE